MPHQSDVALGKFEEDKGLIFEALAFTIERIALLRRSAECIVVISTD